MLFLSVKLLVDVIGLVCVVGRSFHGTVALVLNYVRQP